MFGTDDPHRKSIVPSPAAGDFCRSCGQPLWLPDARTPGMRGECLNAGCASGLSDEVLLARIRDTIAAQAPGQPAPQAGLLARIQAIIDGLDEPADEPLRQSGSALPLR